MFLGRRAHVPERVQGKRIIRRKSRIYRRQHTKSKLPRRMQWSNRTYVSQCPFPSPLQINAKRNITDAEALQVTYDPSKITYSQLLEFFYKMHDPTTSNRQGPDTGTQYRSGIFYHNDEQERIAREVTKKVNEKWWKGKVVTEILPAGEWWDAEDYHQK
jgi:methionine-S-sulfoxide reductase